MESDTCVTLQAAAEAAAATAREAALGAEEKARQLEGWLTEAEDQLAASGQAAAAQLAQVCKEKQVCQSLFSLAYIPPSVVSDNNSTECGLSLKV